MDLTAATVVYCFLVAALYLGLWLYYDHRDHARFEVERRKTSFHCVKCDHIYSAPGEIGLSVCPRCGHENAKLRF